MNPFVAVVEGDAQPFHFLPALCGDQDDPVGSPGTVKCGGSTSFEYRIGFDIKRVDVRDRVAPVNAPANILLSGNVLQRNVVNHNERLVFSAQGIVAPYHNTGGAPFNPVTLRHIHTRRTADHPIQYVGRIRLDDNVRFNTLR